MRTSGYSIAHMSDTHTGSNNNLSNASPVAAYLHTLDIPPSMTVFGGDNNIRDWGTTDYDFRTWIADMGFTLPHRLIIGNHDTLKQPGGDEDFAEGEVPHGKIIAAYPDVFQGRGWWAWSPEDLDILVLGGLNLVDDAEGNYANCNVGTGEEYPRADWSGWSAAGSEQQKFILDAVRNTRKSWVFLFVHRVIYGPYPSTGVGRPTLVASRSGLIRTLTRYGLSGLGQGDQHYRFIGVKYRNPSDDDTNAETLFSQDRRYVGCIPFVNSGGYVCRAIDLTELPGQTEGTHYLYASGVLNDAVASATIWTFNGDSASVSVVECDDGETVTEVYSGTVWRNPAGSYRHAYRVPKTQSRTLDAIIDYVQAAPNLLNESEVITAPGACGLTVYRTGVVTSGAGAEAVTIGSAASVTVGTRKLIELADLVEEGDSVAMDHANIATSDGTATTAVTMDDSGEYLLLEADGTKWRVLYGTATVATGA